MKKTNKKKTLFGEKLAGGNPKNGKVELDYYATNPMFIWEKGSKSEPIVRWL